MRTVMRWLIELSACLQSRHVEYEFGPKMVLPDDIDTRLAAIRKAKVVREVGIS